MPVRGVRGATVVSQDRSEMILSATQELLTAIMEANPSMRVENLTCVFFTVTGDLHSAFPAQAARQLGWQHVPLMCAQEIPVPGSLPHCIRVLLLWNTRLAQSNVHHVYLHEAASLRPDML